MEREFTYLSCDSSEMDARAKRFRECLYNEYKQRHGFFSETERRSKEKRFPQTELVAVWPRTKKQYTEEKNHDQVAIPVPKLTHEPEVAVYVAQPPRTETPPTGKKRANFTQRQRELLDNYFWAHKDHPYVDRQTLEILHQQTGLSRHQIRVFFTNARMRRYKGLKPE